MILSHERLAEIEEAYKQLSECQERMCLQALITDVELKRYESFVQVQHGAVPELLAAIRELQAGTVASVHAENVRLRQIILDFKVAVCFVSAMRPGSDNAFAKPLNAADKLGASPVVEVLKAQLLLNEKLLTDLRSRNDPLALELTNVDANLRAFAGTQV